MKKNAISFDDCFKGFTRDQDKVISPEETVARFYDKAESLDFEIINEVRRIDNGRLDIPVYFSICSDEAQTFTGTKKQMGKGASPEQAKASACMELVERFSFFSFLKNEDHFVRGDYQQMREKGYPVMEPAYLLQSVDDDRMSPETLERLLAGVPMQWTWATNITDNADVLIPFSWFYAINEFNGSSAGNTLEEAALQGIAEVVERDVCSRISQERLETPLIEKTSIKDPVAVDLLQKFEKNHIELYLSDFSLDSGIPTVAALAVDRTTYPQQSEIVFTAGTTPGAEKAVIRALTEVAQLAGDFNTAATYVASGLPKPKEMKEVAYVTDSPKRIDICEMADLADDNIKTEIENCIAVLAARGLSVFMIDVRHPELDIPACYTIIPGARFRERARRREGGLFAAKMVSEHFPNPILFEKKLADMEDVLGPVSYLFFYRGIHHFNNGMYPEAVEQFEKALSQNPDEEELPFIYAYLGHCFKDMALYDSAIAYLEKGETCDPERADISNLLGFCYFKKEEYRTAITHFEKAVALNPSSAMDHANLGVNHSRLGNSNEAVRSFRLALSLDPSLDFARQQLAELTAGQLTPED